MSVDEHAPTSRFCASVDRSIRTNDPIRVACCAVPFTFRSGFRPACMMHNGRCMLATVKACALPNSNAMDSSSRFVHLLWDPAGTSGATGGTHPAAGVDQRPGRKRPPPTVNQQVAGTSDDQLAGLSQGGERGNEEVKVRVSDGGRVLLCFMCHVASGLLTWLRLQRDKPSSAKTSMSRQGPVGDHAAVAHMHSARLLDLWTVLYPCMHASHARPTIMQLQPVISCMWCTHMHHLCTCPHICTSMKVCFYQARSQHLPCCHMLPCRGRGLVIRRGPSRAGDQDQR